MWSRDFKKTGSRILLLLGQLFILIACFLYVELVYQVNILPDKKAKETYQKTDCVVMSKRLTMRGHFFHSYRADFLISYSVGGARYNHWVSGNGLDPSLTRDQIGEEDILTRFDVGATYPCWYNPLHPESAILVARHNWYSTFSLMLPAAVFVLVSYFFIRNLISLLGLFSRKHKRRDQHDAEHKAKHPHK